MDNGNLEEKRQFLQITLFQKESFQRQDYYAIGENISPTCRHHQVLFKKNLLYFELYSKNIILFLSIRFLDLCKEQNSICDKKICLCLIDMALYYNTFSRFFRCFCNFFSKIIGLVFHGGFAYVKYCFTCALAAAIQMQKKHHIVLSYFRSVQICGCRI